MRPLAAKGIKRNYVLHFPKEQSLYDVDWIGIISRHKRVRGNACNGQLGIRILFQALFARVLVDTDAKLLIPKTQSIGRLSGRNGLSSSAVVVLDAKTILVSGFTFRGLAPDTHFWVGRGPAPDASGSPIPDSTGSTAPPGLGRYVNETVVLTLPPGLAVGDVDYLGLWSRGLGLGLAHVDLPARLNVPPAMDSLGIEPEVCATLN